MPAKQSVPANVSYPTIVGTFEANSKKRSKSLFKMESLDLAPLDPEDSSDKPSLVKSILRVLNGPRDAVERLAFETDPRINNTHAGLYKPKRYLIPDSMLKRIAIQDDLVAAIVNARAKQSSAFGRPRPDRFSTGFVIEPKPGVVEKLDEKQKLALDERMEKAIRTLNNCGSNEALKRRDRCTFSQWIEMSAKNAVTLGRIATEIIWGKDLGGEPVFVRFRAIDAGTILQAANYKDSADAVRENAIKMLSRLKNKRLKEERPVQDNDDYSWVQVHDGDPLEVFTDKECVVHNFYPVADIELDGYPVTPLDTIISAVTTHINITTHNKIYFQTGRATRGMLVIKSDEADENVVARVKQQFNASINSVNNAWRMPVFAVGQSDEIEWQPIDNSSRDMEFQYLTDMNARIILSAFQMSPDELPGWSYLSRGTNNQSLSESNNEYKLEAARDLGIRPLLSQFEDFINAALFPLIDEGLSKIAHVRLLGLDAETAEKESVRIQQDMPIHMTYDQVLTKVEKKPVGRAMGGAFPLNPQFQQIVDKYLTVGEVKEVFFGIAGASQDPDLQYYRDEFWFNFQQLKDQRQQMAMQMQQAQQQAAQGGGPGGGGGGGGAPNSQQDPGEGVSDTDQAGGDDDGPASKKPYDAPSEQQKTAQAQQASAGGGEDLTRSIDQAIAVLTKGEDQLPPSKRRLLAQHRLTLKQAVETWEEDLRRATSEIVGVAEKHVKKRN